jgi:DNA polymerase-3 subunit epsilon
MRYVVLDTETTGLEAHLGHRVIEIGCVEVVNRRVTKRNFHTYLNPDRDIDAGAFNVHGLSREFLSEHPRFEDKAKDLIEFVRGSTLIIHNAEFDLKFLNAEFNRLQLGEFRAHCHEVIDSLRHARDIHPGKRNSLDALCDRYDISNKHRTLHGALLDSELLAEVWLAMTRGQESLVIDTGDEPGNRNEIQLGDIDVSSLPVLFADPAELSEHASYLAALDKAAKKPCVWRQWEPETNAA